MSLNKLVSGLLSGVVSIMLITHAMVAETGSQISNNGSFNVTVLKDLEPEPLREFVEFKILVIDVNGKPISDADISLSGGMPAHGHGLPTKPIITAIGNGEYLIEGLKFSMMGTWELNFEIKSKEVSDTAKFTIVK
mgnify:CR=1 FL=1